MKRSAPLSPMASYLPPRSLSPSQVPAARVLHRRLMIDSNSSWASGSALWEDGKYNGKMVGTPTLACHCWNCEGTWPANLPLRMVSKTAWQTCCWTCRRRILWLCSRAKCLFGVWFYPTPLPANVDQLDSDPPVPWQQSQSPAELLWCYWAPSSKCNIETRISRLSDMTWHDHMTCPTSCSWHPKMNMVSLPGFFSALSSLPYDQDRSRHIKVDNNKGFPMKTGFRIPHGSQYLHRP